MYTNMLHGTLCETAEVTGTHPDLDSTTRVPASCTPRPTCPPEGPHLHSSPAAGLAMVLVVLSLTLRGQQDLESHHAVMHQARGLVAPGYSVTHRMYQVLILVAPAFSGEV